MGLAIAHSTLEPTRRRVDVRETVEELRRRHPRLGEDRLAEMLADRIEEDRHLLLDASHVLVRQVLAVMEGRERQRRVASAPMRAAREAVNRREVQAAVAKVKALVVLDTILPSGKLLRYATGSEVAALGEAYQRIAERVGPNAMVGELLTEAEAAELMRA